MYVISPPTENVYMGCTVSLSNTELPRKSRIDTFGACDEIGAALS
jgi:hypothetical protein